MKRRTFCKSSLAAAVGLTTPFGRVLAAGGTASASINDIPVITHTGGEAVLTKAEIKEFGESLYGQLVLQNDPGYETARIVWNGMFNRKPALIARCSGVTDVISAVDFARTHSLLTSIRSGGHSISGKSSNDGGIMIDLSPMQGVRVDPETSTAQVQAGVLLNKLDHEAQTFGLAVTTGTTSHTGLAGLTLGGGLGRLARIYGLTCDNLLSADIVTADGQYLHASNEENEDLFWGLRGGGGNFGVVTSFEYQLHRFGPDVLGGTILYPIAQLRDVLNFYSEYSLTAPDALNTGVVTVRPPGSKGLVIVGVMYTGDESEGERVLQPLLNFGKPATSHIGRENYVEVQRANDGTLRHGLNYYMKAGFTTEIDPGLIDVLDGAFEPHPTRSYVAVLSQMGGAISQVGENDTAFSHRNAEFDFLAGASWTNRDESEDNVAYMREFWKKVVPYTDGFYVNNAMDEGHQRVRATYGSNYDRLVSLKNQYDPTNFFNMNANIKPSA